MKNMKNGKKNMEFLRIELREIKSAKADFQIHF